MLTVTFSGCVSPPEPTSTPIMPTRTPPALPTKAPTPIPTPPPVPAPTPTPEAKVTGAVTYRERIALPAGAIVEVKLLDISKQDAPAVIIGEQVIATTGQQVPFSFEIKYDSTTIDPRYTYAVRATITVDGKLWFTSDTTYPVITRGNPSTVEMVLKNVRASPPSTPTPTPTPTSPQKSWHNVTTISGRGSLSTEPFMINEDEWRIRWSFTMDPTCPPYARFFFTIYPEGEYIEAGRYVRHIENMTIVPHPLGGNSTIYSGTTYIHQGHDSFYVKMESSMQSWELEIEEYR